MGTKTKEVLSEYSVVIIIEKEKDYISSNTLFRKKGLPHMNESLSKTFQENWYFRLESFKLICKSSFPSIAPSLVLEMLGKMLCCIINQKKNGSYLRYFK